MTVIAIDADAMQRALEGRTIVGYEATEMALWEQGPGGLPVFSHPEVPCVQCLSLMILFEDGTELRIQTNPYDVEWGLIIVGDVPPNERNLEIERDEQSIYRSAALGRFPVGVITRVTVTPAGSGKGQVRALVLELGERAVTLVAGEFEEQFDGSVRLLLDDDSILFFPSGDGLDWAEAQVARGPIRPATT